MHGLLRVVHLSICLTALTFMASGVAMSSPASPTLQSAEQLRRDWLRTVFVPGHGVDARVVKEIADTGRSEFVPVLIELLRFREGQHPDVADALRRLTGQNFGDDWLQWVEWLGTQNIPPPAGFDAWKGELLALIDPNFQEFIYDAVPTRIKLEEVVWGGVLKDGIPALVNPQFIPARDATYLEDTELVFGLSINGDARAYPHRILDWHEMANDVVGGVPIALTY